MWETRNHLIFKGLKADLYRAIDMVKFRITWWFKHLRKGSKEAITLMLLNISEVCSDSNPRKELCSVVWQPPSFGSLKFNVNGSAKGSPGLAGMGGILRNHCESVLCLFSVHLGVQDSNSAEILAIHKACEICVTHPSFQGFEVTIVSDSTVAVSWVNGEGFGSLKHVNAIYDVRSMLNWHGNLKVIHNPRASNSFADMLAKKGSNNEGDFTFLGG